MYVNSQANLERCEHTGLERTVLKLGDASLAVVALVCQRGHVRPAESVYEVDESLSLVRVWRHNAREVTESTLVAQFDSCRRVADLRYLKTSKRASVNPLMGTGIY